MLLPLRSMRFCSRSVLNVRSLFALRVWWMWRHTLPEMRGKGSCLMTMYTASYLILSKAYATCIQWPSHTHTQFAKHSIIARHLLPHGNWNRTDHTFSRWRCVVLHDKHITHRFTQDLRELGDPSRIDLVNSPQPTSLELHTW